MELNLFATKDQLAAHRLSVLLKGRSGSGKTRAGLSFPGPALLLYSDVNRKTVHRMVELGAKVYAVQLETWSQYADFLVPMIRNRKVVLSETGEPEIHPNTIIVDTVDFLAEMMWADIQGTRSKLTIQDFGTGLRRMAETTNALVSCTRPRNGHAGYHVVFTSHLKDVTDDGGALLRVAPAVMGQFADKIEDYFDYVLLMQSELTSSIKMVSGTQTNVKSKQFKVSTVGDRFNTCKGDDVMPPEFVVPEGKEAFEVMNQWWKIEA